MKSWIHKSHASVKYSLVQCLRVHPMPLVKALCVPRESSTYHLLSLVSTCDNE